MKKISKGQTVCSLKGVLTYMFFSSLFQHTMEIRVRENGHGTEQQNDENRPMSWPHTPQNSCLKNSILLLDDLNNVLSSKKTEGKL